MLGCDDQPLVAVQVSEGYVGEEVVAERGLGFGGEVEGLGAGLAEFSDEVYGVGPAAGGEVHFAGFESGVAGLGEALYPGFLGGGFGFLFGGGWGGESVGDYAGDEALEDDAVLDDFCDGPA